MQEVYHKFVGERHSLETILQSWEEGTVTPVSEQTNKSSQARHECKTTSHFQHDQKSCFYSNHSDVTPKFLLQNATFTKELKKKGTKGNDLMKEDHKLRGPFFTLMKITLNSLWMK